jgi:toxin CptA
LITHNAPPVVYPLGRSGLLGGVLSGLWCAGMLLAALWLYTSRPSGWAIFLVAASVLLAAVAALFGWKNSPVGQLAWDGQFWRWESQGYQAGVAEQQLCVIADFQHILLLRIENQAHASLWLWAERRAFAERWMDLRRAVYSPKRAASVPTPAETAADGVAAAAPASP